MLNNDDIVVVTTFIRKQKVNDKKLMKYVKRNEVLDLLAGFGSKTVNEIADALKRSAWEISMCIKDLEEDGEVTSIDKDMSVGGKGARKWNIKK